MYMPLIGLYLHPSPSLSVLVFTLPQGEWRAFPEIADDLAARYKVIIPTPMYTHAYIYTHLHTHTYTHTITHPQGAVVTDAVVQSRITKAEALALLDEHLLKNTVYLPR